jgi:probable HAF family extracellular repeat protein
MKKYGLIFIILFAKDFAGAHVQYEITAIGGYNALGINDNGQVVGEGPPAFLWDNAYYNLGSLAGPDNSDSRALAINDLGQVVGHSLTANGQIHAFLWENNLMMDLGTMATDYDYSCAYGINNFGQIVGYSGYRSGASTQFFMGKRCLD